MSIRQQRVEGRIRAILGELLLRAIRDPRLQNVTVTEVTLDPELVYADVYVNALGEEERAPEVLVGLARANGFLRREVGRRLRVRVVPELRFHWDAVLEQGARMDELINSLDIPPEALQEDDEPQA